MTDPVLVLHGVANRDKTAFEAQVTDLNRRVGASWRFVPVFWGDLGAAVEGLADTIPQPRSLSIRSEGAAETNPALVASFLAGTPGASRTRDAGEGWRIVAETAAGEAAGRFPHLVRGGEDDEVIRQAIAEEWSQTTTLQNVTDAVLLAEIGRAIATGLSETDDQSARTRSFGEDLTARVKGLLKGIDQAVGSVVGLLAGRVNEYLRTSFGPNLGQFLGDVFVYQRHRKEIEERLWEVVDQEAPGWGTEQQPVRVVAHSLGGVIGFYTAVAPAAGRQLWIDRFVTFGSQSAFFHVLDPRGGGLPVYYPGTSVELPRSVGGWTNLWEPLDPLAFLAGKIFFLNPASAKKRPIDIEVPHRASSSLWTHSVYWADSALVEAIRQAFA